MLQEVSQNTVLNLSKSTEHGLFTRTISQSEMKEIGYEPQVRCPCTYTGVFLPGLGLPIKVVQEKFTSKEEANAATRRMTAFTQLVATAFDNQNDLLPELGQIKTNLSNSVKGILAFLHQQFTSGAHNPQEFSLDPLRAIRNSLKPHLNDPAVIELGEKLFRNALAAKDSPAAAMLQDFFELKSPSIKKALISAYLSDVASGRVEDVAYYPKEISESAKGSLTENLESGIVSLLDKQSYVKLASLFEKFPRESVELLSKPELLKKFENAVTTFLISNPPPYETTPLRKAFRDNPITGLSDIFEDWDSLVRQNPGAVPFLDNLRAEIRPGVLLLADRMINADLWEKDHGEFRDQITKLNNLSPNLKSSGAFVDSVSRRLADLWSAGEVFRARELTEIVSANVNTARVRIAQSKGFEIAIRTQEEDPTKLLMLLLSTDIPIPQDWQRSPNFSADIQKLVKNVVDSTNAQNENQMLRALFNLTKIKELRESLLDVGGNPGIADSLVTKLENLVKGPTGQLTRFADDLFDQFSRAFQWPEKYTNRLRTAIVEKVTESLQTNSFDPLGIVPLSRFTDSTDFTSTQFKQLVKEKLPELLKNLKEPNTHFINWLVKSNIVSPEEVERARNVGR